MVEEPEEMPVVTLSYDRLSSMVGAPVQKIRDFLPYLGLDIEYEDNDTVRIEYSPNRPDYSTEFGVSIGLQGILGITTGLYRINVHDSDRHLVAHDSVSAVRSCITGIAAMGGVLDDHSIRQIISMQEDLHQGLGRRRAKLAIGLHDMDALQFPLTYTVKNREFEFVPLGHDESMSINDILSNTEQGRAYGALLPPGPVPIIHDERGTVASMPPVINSGHTTVTAGTRNILVDITGNDRTHIENALSVVCVTLQAAGFTIQRLNISGAGNSTPPLNDRVIDMDVNMSNSVLGLDMNEQSVIDCIRKSRLDGYADSGIIKCTIPPYRFDILGEMDLVEEVALGYGIYNMEPALPPSPVPGQASMQSRNIRYVNDIMTGLGYMEVMNSSLVGEQIQRNCGRSGSDMMVSNPKSQSHTMLRDILLPGLLGNLSSNIHEPYPHKLYEIGTIFIPRDERLHLGCIVAHKDASYSEIKSILSGMCRDLGVDVQTPSGDEGMFLKEMFQVGCAAHVCVGECVVGSIGEVYGAVRDAFKIREGISVAAFEVDLGLIFELCGFKSAP